MRLTSSGSPASETGASAPVSTPCTLEDLSDDLLRRSLREYSLTLKDVIRFGMCNRRLRSVVQGGGVLRELEVEVQSHSLHSPKEHGTDLCLRADPQALDWLCS
jgi:hypothetical protein